MTAGNLRQAIDKTGQFADPDTITREEYRRVHGTTPAAVILPTGCLECGAPLTINQLRNRGRFCSHRCAGRNTGRREHGPDIAPPHEATQPTKEGPVGIVHDLIGDEFDTVTGERNNYPMPTLCEQCGRPYQQKRKSQRFCSSGCAGKWNAQHRPARQVPTTIPMPETRPAAINGHATAATADLPGLLGQILAAAGEWHLEARIGDVELTLTRPAP